MGAKDWMLLYAEGEVRPVLQQAPPPDRDATHRLVQRLYPGHRLTAVPDGTLLEHANPPDRHVYAAVMPGLDVVCTRDAALDRPSRLDRRFRDEAGGRTLYLHAMHSVVDWLAYAVWDGDSRLRRALSLSPDGGVTENLGDPLAFEAPYWAGERAVPDDDDEAPYRLPFHPLELSEDALRHLFGFVIEGMPRPDDPDLGDVVLVGYALDPR